MKSKGRMQRKGEPGDTPLSLIPACQGQQPSQGLLCSVGVASVTVPLALNKKTASYNASLSVCHVVSTLVWWSHTTCCVTCCRSHRTSLSVSYAIKWDCCDD